MDLEREKTSKKHYESPNLVIYGDIREITQNVGNKGNSDGGISPKEKTHA
jgi:hypothetical protein